MANFYLTTTIPYVNAEPHIGFALEIIQADAIARWHRAIGDEVFFNFGTDEHGQKIYQQALAAGISPQAYCNEYAAKFALLKEALNLSYTNFIRTTDAHHKMAATEFWKRCLASGDIYKKLYAVKYCVGCELEKTDSELVDGRCPLHPNKDLEIREEENYFFKFSNYQAQLLDFYSKHPTFVVPSNKLLEIKNFVASGLQDFSISRLKAKMPWGIDVPGDSEHVMYVWFDALINYISAIGWPDNESLFHAWWPVTQFAGKDQVRQQAAMWQAMLFSAKLPQSKQIFIHGFLTLNGQKISKSLGNTIDPIDVVKDFGTDTLRYYLLAKVHPWDDSDFNTEKLTETYNGDLANGLGNVVSRVAKLCENTGFTQMLPANKTLHHVFGTEEYTKAMEEFRFPDVASFIWRKITTLDKYINEEQPWVLAKNQDPRVKEVLAHSVDQLQEIAVLLDPLMPETAAAITKQFTAAQVMSQPPLFPRR